MKAKHVAWIAVTIITAAAVGSTAALGVAVHQEYSELDHGQAPQSPEVSQLVQPQQPQAVDTADMPARLDEMAQSPALPTLGAQVVNTSTGEVLWEHDSQEALIPASSTKVLTAAAAALLIDDNEKLKTEVLHTPGSNTVVIKAAGDVWMTAEQMDELAEEIQSSGAGADGIDTVLIDTSIWSGDDQAPGWDPSNVDGGFVAPMQPAMLYGGRIGDTEGDVPRSHTPALDVASALAERIDAPNVGTGEVPEGAEPIAAVESEPFGIRAEQMMKHSDNVMAEAIARELARAAGAEPSFEGATKATLKTLSDASFNTEGITIMDNSGLSEDNRITADLLTRIIADAATNEPLREVLGYLPVAGGEGTLTDRYADLSGKGFVRAKTGTLTGVSALSGTALGESGTVYAFTFLVNDGDILGARQAQDAMASVLREY
ncbi:D-alanyl-D-alanine carboxypeptidase/D-alanyl-D-alanine endopeptidase [Corynebacterium stationis]|uniref:D-alanyl-D-alanine carboxypeptidase/D-alanyl-D-alanine endopeptidase n=1 Tax=Corynebacterium stationis TaxID=1705 RepID=UPI00242D4130|nr:D-alanyl-D-alanine carboxypeptidase/D-alanyl-D-alanine-endopeptidase [Corynebacterium stationis]